MGCFGFVFFQRYIYQQHVTQQATSLFEHSRTRVAMGGKQGFVFFAARGTFFQFDDHILHTLGTYLMLIAEVTHAQKGFNITCIFFSDA